MECTETTEGLTRMYRIVIPAAQLQATLDAKIQETAPKVQLKGFRAGKVPPSHIKRVYGASLFREIIDEEVQRSTKEAIADLRIASEPHLHLETELEEVTAGKADLAFHFHVDLMPEFEPVDPASLSVERPVTPVSDEQVEERLETLAKANKTYADKDGAAEDGDELTVDFVGKLNGEPFDRGAAEGQRIVIGSNQLIPGFESGLIGAKAGEERVLNVTFPDNYAVETLKGQDATFDVKVHAVRAPEESKIDDAFAEKLGVKSLDELRNLLRSGLESEHAAQTRVKTKRVLFDQLDAQHSFELPPGMVDSEFNAIWRQIEADKAAGELDEEDKAKDDETLKADYRKIAERRVRLGLVLGEIGRRNKVEVREEEVAAAISEQARRFPGQERQLFEFYQKNPNALAQIRAPLYEDKVVDFILELATTSDKTVSRDELFAEDETETPANA